MAACQFFIGKLTNTSADIAVTLGFADLMKQVLKAKGKPGKGIIIQNAGEAFEITLPCSLDIEELHSQTRIPFLELLISAKQDERQAKKGHVLRDGFDYDGEREKQKQLLGRLKQLPPRLRTPEARLRKEPELEAILGDGPSPELAHYEAITMLKVADTFNALVLRWQSLSATQQWLAIGLLFRLFSQRENDLTTAMKAWEELAKDQGIDSEPTASAVQVINPTSGKGSNVSKSYGLTNNGLKSFWLLELLKFKGFMLGAAPYVIKDSKSPKDTKERKDNTGRKKLKDRKTYVILPETVELETLTRIMNDFRRICWSSTAIKQDVLAALRLAQVLVNQRRVVLSSQQGDLDPFDEQPIISITRGFDVTFYKGMRNAHATMNVSTINIPTWFPVLSTLQQVEEAELLLQEHIRLIRRIEGYQGKEESDELELLRTYRDFLSGHDLRSFWQFAVFYSSYMFRQREHEKDVKRWLPQLTQKGLDLLVTNHQNTNAPLSPILQSPGFQNIASAIREATVRAQRRRSQENDTTYEVRYGLGQELMRKARYRNDFMVAISEFIMLYNAETAREEEKIARDLKRRLRKEDYHTRKLRFPVTTEDMDQLGELLDTYPTELVASMLIAYGYARREVLKQEELERDSTRDLLADAEIEPEEVEEA